MVGGEYERSYSPPLYVRMVVVSSPDFQDFTQGSSRLMQQLAGSPVASIVAGVNSATLPVPDFARSLNLLVTVPANIITLTVVGATTGFTYLNAVPAYDGGIYYLPAMPIVDDHVTLTWYQVAATAVNIYVIASDEPISVSLFNPVAPAQAIRERLPFGFPQTIPANTQATTTVKVDATSAALRCTVDNPAHYLWGKVVGVGSGKVYFDGSATNTQFPITPIPIDSKADSSIHVIVQTVAASTVLLYVALINVPDFAGNIPLVNPMSANELAPDPKQSDIPNQQPAIFDGTIAISGTQLLVAGTQGPQLRVHAILIMQYTSVATNIELQDTLGNPFCRYHYSAASNMALIPLFGQLAPRAEGLQLKNILAVATGALAVTLWYSVL